jgi:hypothetical protein
MGYWTTVIPIDEHVASRSALLEQMDQVLLLGFLPFLKGLDWQCMGYWTTVIPIDER